MKTFSDENSRIAWLRLARTKNVGSRTFIELLKLYGNPQDAIKNVEDIAKKGGAKSTKLVPSESMIEKEILNTKKHGAKIILACDKEYPSILKNMPDFPAVLVCKGNIDLLKKNIFAIIGARNSSTNGNKISYNFAKEISNAGYVITSGLAKGIDSYAHQGSLENGTIAVIAGGIEHIYPKENFKLYQDIYSKGLVITEQAIYSTVSPQNFPKRNRIIAGICTGLVVIEASKKSGTLITTRLALEYNKEVYAVPGSPLDDRSSGTNELIKKGANIATSAQDIISDLDNNFILSDKNAVYKDICINTRPTEQELVKHREKLINLLCYSPTNMEDIFQQMGNISINILNCLILELELAGKIERDVFGRINLL